MTAVLESEAGEGRGRGAAACANCDEVLVGDFCHRCGEKSVDARDLSLRHFAGEAAQELVSVEHSKLYRTTAALLFRPGRLSLEYFSGRRGRYLKPLNLCLFVFALSLFAYSFYKPVSMYDLERFVRLDQTGNISGLVDKWAAGKNLPRGVLIEQISDRWHGYTSLLQPLNVVLFALFLQAVHLFSRRYFVEHLVFAMHFLAFSLLTVVLLFPVYLLTGINPTPATRALALGKWLVDIAYMFFAVRVFYRHGVAVSLPLSVVLVAGYFVSYLIVYVGALLAAVVGAGKM